MLFIEYPKCTTCIKARKYLESKTSNFTLRNIKEDNPSVDELKQWHKLSGLELNKLFNTSGLIYKDLNLKEKLPSITDEEKYQLLASNGMLVKRPILVLDDVVFFGFKENFWEVKLK